MKLGSILLKICIGLINLLLRELHLKICYTVQEFLPLRGVYYLQQNLGLNNDTTH